MTKEDIDASEAPLLDHLIELRTRLIYCVIGFIVTFIISFYFSSNILEPSDPALQMGHGH